MPTPAPQPSAPECPNPDSPQVHYVGSATDCLAVFFMCEEAQTGFNDECGCGCID